MQANATRRRRFESRSNRGPVKRGQRSRPRRLGMEALEARHLLTGTWTVLTNALPTATPGTMELLTDGSVMQLGNNAQSWNKLTPDSAGNYVNGTWSAMANMSTTRLYDATNVLKDGRILVLGGQYTSPPYTQTFTNTGEIYNPVTNVWTGMANFPEPNFGDNATMLMSDGRLLAGAKDNPNTYIYDPASNTWSSGPTKLDSDASYAETWTKLADGSILSYDNWGTGTQAQRFDPSSNSWIESGASPVALQSSTHGGGPSVLLPDGRVFIMGATGNTALYTPATNPGDPGTWAAGPVIPGGLVAKHSSAAMLPNGHVLFAAGATVGGSPIHLFEFDPSAPIDSSLTDVSPVPGAVGQTWPSRMLMLPNGQVLAVLPNTSSLMVYTPDGAPQTAWQPTITSVVANGSNYTLTGTQLNGLSAGASYGGGAEMDSNYPIVELNDGAGHVYFARTSNWSSTGVATGSTPVTTDFSLPANMPYGNYNLVVVANGIASAPASFTGGIVGPSADLAVTNTGPATSAEGSNVTYSLTVTNNGPTDATNVVLTDTLDPNLKYVSTTKSQGTVAHSSSVVTFSLGTVAVGQTVTATVTAQSIEDGNLTDTVSVTSDLPDANLNNNTSAVTTAVAEPAIVVSGPINVSGKNQSNVTVATFTHASGVEPANAFAATIAWGDGSTSAGTVALSGLTYTVKGSHNYAGRGSHTVTTTVVESGSSPNFATASFATASVATVPTAASASASTFSAPTTAREAIFASTTGAGGAIALSSSNVDGAGAQMVSDTDSLDALFGLLDSSDGDPLHAGKSKGLWS